MSISEYYITVYDLLTGSQVFELKISNQEKQRWPNLHFSDDDKLVFMVREQGIISFDSSEGFQEWKKFPVKNCEELSISPGYQGTFRIAAVTPEVLITNILITFKDF